jgi:hypothetical protein
MLETLLPRLGMLFVRLRFLTDKDHVQPMTEFLRGARNALIILPVGYEDAVLASNSLFQTCRELAHVHLTVIHTSTRATSLAVYPKCEVLRLDRGDLNRFSLPTRSLMKRVFKREYDVAMDLNLDFVLHTAYICKASGARVRVGCSRDGSDLFYNVQLNLDKHGSPQVLYQKFAACLAMF